jgi:hypothetical protein
VPMCACRQDECAGMHDSHETSMLGAHFVAPVHTGARAGGRAGMLGVLQCHAELTILYYCIRTNDIKDNGLPFSRRCGKRRERARDGGVESWRQSGVNKHEREEE